MVNQVEDLGMTQPQTLAENQSDEDGTEEQPVTIRPINYETKNTLVEEEEGEPDPSTSEVTKDGQPNS